ncbi:MAG: hypothetical protein WCG95_00125 [bacterium]
MLKHCGIFKADDIWSLKDVKGFTDCKLLIGCCPRCQKEVVRLEETRIEDGKLFVQIRIGVKSDKLKAKCKPRLIKVDKTVPRGKLYGFVYGINTEIHNNKGQVVKIRQRACDWHNHKALVREVKTTIK